MLAPPSSSRKRKRGGTERLLLGSPFVVQPHISSSFDAATKISPSVVLPRSHIPIGWLAGAPSRIFDAPTDSPVLCVPGNVVIVKIEGERQLSAVEKIGGNVYALYRLSTQLRMKDIRKVASQTKHLPNIDFGPGQYDIYEADWWCGAGDASYPFSNDLYGTACHAALDMGICNSESVEGVRNTPIVSQVSLSPLPAAANENTAHESTETPMSEVLGQIRRQYFDTLYLTKTSLAYFSKSTLSRARATCHDIEATSLASRFGQLNEFLQQMLLPLDILDTKYRESLVQNALEQEVGNPMVFRPDEESFIQRWRLLEFQERFIKESDPELKQKLEKLRIREYVRHGNLII
ncbi:DNA replication regulator SLD3-domain-containing protein [Trichophaea hybrida]|nr:DNA replication regulator SLD3-domain-containing protein [Trichophaea hybrida]